jgi:hypothetical protein
MNADDDTINLIWDRTAYQVDHTIPLRGSGYVRHRRVIPIPDIIKRSFICVHLASVLIRFYLRQKACEVVAPSELKLIGLSHFHTQGVPDVVKM